MTKICTYFEVFERKRLTGERVGNVTLSFTKNEKNSYKFYSHLKKPLKFAKISKNLNKIYNFRILG